MGKEENIETLDLSESNEEKEINENLEGVSEKNIEETIVNEDIDQGIKNENMEEEIMKEDNPVDNVYGEEVVGLDNLGDDNDQNDAPKKGKLSMLIILIVIILIAVLAFGIYMWNKSNNEKLKESLKEPALDYFDKYMSVGTGTSAYAITLDDLKNANKNGENYNLKGFEKCDGQKTQAIISINYSNGEVDKVEIKLSCKIF